MDQKPVDERVFADEAEAEAILDASRHRLFAYIVDLKDDLPADKSLELMNRAVALAVAAHRLALARQRSALRLLHPEQETPPDQAT